MPTSQHAISRDRLVPFISQATSNRLSTELKVEATKAYAIRRAIKIHACQATLKSLEKWFLFTLVVRASVCGHYDLRLSPIVARYQHNTKKRFRHIAFRNVPNRAWLKGTLSLIRFILVQHVRKFSFEMKLI